MYTFAYVLCICLLAAARLYSVVPGFRSRRHGPLKRTVDQSTCSLAVFLGSGGHTSEALQLVSSLDFARYSPRTYVVSQGDTLSAEKAASLETLKAAERPEEYDIAESAYRTLIIPRARQVHQSLLTTPPTALYSFLSCIYLICVSPFLRKRASRRPFADVLILNGPGTCVPVCAAVILNRFFGLPSPRVIYVESFARVRSLSLSGYLLYNLVDCFVVQWPDLARDYGRARYRGWLV